MPRSCIAAVLIELVANFSASFESCRAASASITGVRSKAEFSNELSALTLLSFDPKRLSKTLLASALASGAIVPPPGRTHKSRPLAFAD